MRRDVRFVYVAFRSLLLLEVRLERVEALAARARVARFLALFQAPAWVVGAVVVALLAFILLLLAVRVARVNGVGFTTS